MCLPDGTTVGRKAVLVASATDDDDDDDDIVLTEICKSRFRIILTKKKNTIQICSDVYTWMDPCLSLSASRPALSKPLLGRLPARRDEHFSNRERE